MRCGDANVYSDAMSSPSAAPWSSPGASTKAPFSEDGAFVIGSGSQVIFVGAVDEIAGDRGGRRTG